MTLTPTMRTLLRGAIHVSNECWYVPRPESAGTGRAMAGLKTRGLVTWHHARGCTGWVLTHEGEVQRQYVVTRSGVLRLL